MVRMRRSYCVVQSGHFSETFVWRRGRDYSALCASPSGPPSLRAGVVSRLRARLEPGRLKPMVRMRRSYCVVQSGHFSETFVWRRGRDSNPRYGVTVHTLSRRAPSAARTPLRNYIRSRHPGIFFDCSPTSDTGRDYSGALHPRPCGAAVAMRRRCLAPLTRRSARTLGTGLPYTHFPGVLVTQPLPGFAPAGPPSLHSGVVSAAPRLSRSDTSPELHPQSPYWHLL